ncbi:MAG TPA: hypothetical protein VGU90_01000 [Terriglobales bacterium]|nr:hypothetical protein [Terriglobales bacterium]
MQRRVIGGVLAAVFLSAVFTIARLNAAKAEAPMPAGLALTLYNQQFAVVRQPIELNLQQGVNHIRYSETTAHLEPESVMLRDPSGEHQLQILEQNYRNDPVTEARLLSAYEGKEIEFEINRNGTPQIIKAKIIRSGYVPHYNAFQRYGAQYQYQQMSVASGEAGEGSPIVEIDGQIQFGLPGRPIFPSLKNDSLMKPTLDWLLHSDTAGKVAAELSYVTGGMTWAADYNAVAPEHGDTLDITGWVTMDNQSGKTFDQAQIKLMAGEVNKIQPTNGANAYAVSGMAMEDRAMAMPQVQEKAFDEYHLYTLPRPVTLHDRETKQVEFIRASNVKSEHVYVYDGAKITQQYQYWGIEQIRQNREYGTEMNSDVWVMQEIKNSKANNLGIPLPKGRVRFYRRDTDGALEFIGENEIKHTPTDETLRIFTGNAFDLVGERRQTNYQIDLNNHKIDESFEIKVRNHKKESANLRIVEHLYRCLNWEITSKSDDFIKTDSRTAEFRVRIPAGGEKTLTYTAHYTW